MKLLTSFFAFAALSLITSAFAQDESPSPSAAEEATPAASLPATSEASPFPSAREERTPASATATEKKEGPSATIAATPKKNEGAESTKPGKGASAPAAKPAKKMSAEASLKDMENKWEAAVPNHDVKAVEPMVSSDFVGVSSKGKFINKSSLLAELKSDKDTYKSAKNEKLNVRQYDKDVAVVTGSAREKGTGKDGKPFDRTYRFTDTWVERNGNWQCVASQVMLLGQK